MAGSTWVMLEKKGSRPGTRSSHAITVVGGTAYSFGGELIPRVPVGSTMYAFDLKTAATPPSAADREKWGREMGYGGGALCSFPFSGSGLGACGLPAVPSPAARHACSASVRQGEETRCSLFMLLVQFGRSTRAGTGRSRGLAVMVMITWRPSFPGVFAFTGVAILQIAFRGWTSCKSRCRGGGTSCIFRSLCWPSCRSRSRGPLQAVTFAFATVRRFPWRQVPAYMLAQMLGATLAGATLRLVFGGHHERFPGTPPAGSEVQSLVLEFIVTFYLMFAISGVATDNRALIPNNLKVSRTQHYVTYHYQLQYLFWRKASAFDGICRNLKDCR